LADLFFIMLMIHLQQALQSLLIPCALTAPPGSPYLHRAAHAAMAACELQRKRLREDYMAPLAVYSLHKLFMSGVFMLFALDKDRSLSVATDDARTEFGPENNISPGRRSSSYNGISPKVFLQVKHCQEALSIYAGHYPQAKPYAQCFENMSKIWLRRFDERDTRQEISAQRHLSPEITNRPLIHQSFENQFKPACPPTLWKDDLNLPGRVRSSVEGSALPRCDANLQFQPGSPQYHLLSLGLVEPTCEPAQLLKSEEERYQSQKPWMHGHIEREFPNELRNDNTSQLLDPNFSNSVSPYLSDQDNHAPTLTDSAGSFLPGSALGVESQLICNFQDHQAKLSEYSPRNDAFGDQNFNNNSGNYSSNSTTEFQTPDPERSCRIGSTVSLTFDNSDYSPNVPEDMNENMRKRSFMSQQMFFGQEIQSSFDPKIDAYPSLVANDQSQRNQLSSNAWLGEAFEFVGNPNDLSLNGGDQVPNVNLSKHDPTEAQGKNDDCSSSVALALGENVIQNEGFVPTHPGLLLEPTRQQDFHDCIKTMLAGQGDYKELANNQYTKLPGDLISSDKRKSGEMMLTESSKLGGSSESNDALLFQGSFSGYGHTLG
jgi:hypothetical protein